MPDLDKIHITMTCCRCAKQILVMDDNLPASWAKFGDPPDEYFMCPICYDKHLRAQGIIGRARRNRG